MNKIHIFLISLIMITLTGCESTGDKSGNYGVQGCIGGALLGAGIAALTGGDGRNVGRSAAAGCAVGAVVGYQVGKRTQVYANDKQAVTEEIAYNHNLSRDIRRKNEKLANNIRTYRNDIASLKRQQMSTQARQSALAEERTKVQKQQRIARDGLNKVNVALRESRKRYRQYQAVATADEQSQWQRRISQLESERNQLEGHVSELNAMNASI